MRRLQLFTGNIITKLINAFKARVSGDSGTFEGENWLKTNVTKWKNNQMLGFASLILTPNAYNTSKLYNLQGSPDFSFSRASAKTRYNSSLVLESLASNIAAINYPSDGSEPYFEFSPSRTNLAKYSQDFTQSIWQKSNATVVSNNAIAPDGTLTASTITFSGINSQLIQSFTTSVGVSYTYTLWIKGISGQRTNVNILQSSSPFTRTSLNLLFDGTWQKVSLTYTAVDTITEIQIRNNYPIANLTATVFNVWFVQCEAGTYSTPYIPTTSATSTRLNDAASISGLQTAGIFGATTGTVIIDFKSDNNGLVAAPEHIYFTNSVGTILMWLQSAIAGSSSRVADKLNGNTTISGLFSSATRCKLAIVWTATTCKIFVNGSQIGSTYTFTPINMGALDSISFANGGQMALYMIAFFNTNISDSQAQTFTI